MDLKPSERVQAYTYSFDAQRSPLTSVVAGPHSAQREIARNEQVVGSSPTSGSQ